MAQRDHDIYASLPVRGLLAEETAALAPDLQRCTGSHALQVSAARHDYPPALPMLGGWVRLRLTRAGYEGDLRGDAGEPLPFADDTFGLVLLRHAVETAPSARVLLHEAARVLAPGGLLALTGVHPFSAWTPWWLWRTRRSGLSLSAPMGLVRWLHDADLTVERVRRVGSALPAGSGDGGRSHAGPLGGGYLLIARKHRRAQLPVRLRPKAISHPVGAGLAPGARRSSAA
ncbi:methyltransferase domain-containing protein [Frateuria sp. Soil773]|uniref:methyltransferase domain-containing protein n=1 Tax=Frateuria sp. Soil773 TaxID=1736407 RepID=UPI0009EADEF8|nr:methyltransferase domain-containing protein [Frateuria sp. Soil773]